MTLHGEVRLIETPLTSDSRGVFSKPFPPRGSTDAGFEIKELFWTTSSRGTIRGMHFQTPPAPSGKIVWVSRGSVIDVVVDIRSDGDFGRVHSFELGADVGSALWIPTGFAHGFQALEDDSIVNYAVDDVFSPENDAGIRWDSVGFDWPLPLGEISTRDTEHPRLAEYATPFRVEQ